MNGLSWTDETGLLPTQVFTDCAVPANLIGCIGYATSKIDDSLTASLVTPDVLSQAMSDCQDYIFSDELDKKISTMMKDCNQVFSLFIFLLFILVFRLFKICLLLRRLDWIIFNVLF